MTNEFSASSQQCVKLSAFPEELPDSFRAMHAAIAVDSGAERIRTREEQSSEVQFTRKVQTHDPDWAPETTNPR